MGMSFNALLQELYERWWFAGIILPAFLTVVLGVPIALYTGLVAARFVLFRSKLEAIRQAFERVFLDMDEIFKEESRQALENNILKPIKKACDAMHYEAEQQL